MKLIYAIGAVAVFTAIVASCGGQSEETGYEELKKAEWLIGRWENNSPEGDLSETWNRENDSTLHGATYYVIQGDTVFSESINVRQEGKDLWYTVVIPDQNDGKPIAFKLIRSSEKMLVFENKKHDYPQQIKYELSGKTITASISGERDGHQASEKFVMTKK